MARSYTILTIECEQPLADMLIAELAQVGFDSFLMIENGFEASILSDEYAQAMIDEILSSYSLPGAVSYKVNEVEEENWNREWERNFDPVVIDDFCRIRASFHDPDPTFPLEIIINPKMSFGTGHHDTTCLMIQHQLKMDLLNKKVLDAGCGTGILSIVSEKLGAGEVTGFDTDERACENALENVLINSCHKIRILQGGVDCVPAGLMFDLLLANINLNVILSDIRWYAERLKPGGSLVLSGFYTNDYPILEKAAHLADLQLDDRKSRNKWMSLVYRKFLN